MLLELRLINETKIRKDIDYQFTNETIKIMIPQKGKGGVRKCKTRT